MERIDEKPDRFESKRSNIGTFREGHGHRALAGLEHDLGLFYTRWVEKWGRSERNEHQRSGAERKVGKSLQEHYSLSNIWGIRTQRKSAGGWEEAVAPNWRNSVLEIEERGSGGG